MQVSLAGDLDLPEIGLLLRFDNPPALTFITTMQTEVTRLLVPADLRVRWMTPEDLGAQTFTRALVFSFHGDCRALPAETASERVPLPVILAETAVSESTILPFGEVNCDRLRGFLSGEGPRGAGVESRLGLATARVVAHEMYHVLLQTKEHGKTGISRAAHTPSALLSKSLRFDDEELSRMRARFGPAREQTPQYISFKPN
jgi:hypothetical protein